MGSDVFCTIAAYTIHVTSISWVGLFISVQGKHIQGIAIVGNFLLPSPLLPQLIIQSSCGCVQREADGFLESLEVGK